MNKYFTDEEIKWLEENYETCTPEEAVKALGREWSSITHYCSRNKIRKKHFKKKENDGRKFHVLPNNTATFDLIPITDFIKELGISMQELDMWLAIYPDELKLYRRKGKYVLIIERAYRFLEKHKGIWDATKVQKDFFDECDWFGKKHEEDFERMIKERWGSWAK